MTETNPPAELPANPADALVLNMPGAPGKDGPSIKLTGKTWAGASGILAAAMFVHTQLIIPAVGTIAERKADAAVEEFDQEHSSEGHPHEVTRAEMQVEFTRLIEKLEPLATQASVDLIQNNLEHATKEIGEMRKDIDELESAER